MNARRPSAAAFLLGAMLLASALAPSPARADDLDVRLRRNDDKSYEVAGLFSVKASSAVVWGVLEDYAEIPAFVHSMKRSAVRETRPDGTVLVEQEAVGGLFLISKKVHILLEIRRAPERLDFVDVGREDFRSYSGDWRTQPAAGGTLVTYDLRADPRFPAPGFVMKGVMRRGAIELLQQVRDEIDRRDAAARPGAAPTVKAAAPAP